MTVTYYGFYTDVGAAGGDVGQLIVSHHPGSAGISITAKLWKMGSSPTTLTLTTDASGFANAALPAPLTYTQLLEVSSATSDISVQMVDWSGATQTNYTVMPIDTKSKGTLFYATSASFNNSICFGNPSASSTATVTLYSGSGAVLTTLTIPAKCASRYNLAAFSTALKATSNIAVVCGVGIEDAAGMNMLLPSP